MEPLAQQNKTLEIQRGLFLIKYESADDEASPPRVIISPDPSSANDVELILPPDADEAVLWSPGGCLVVRSSQHGRVEVAVVPAQPNGSVVARVKLVPLSNDPHGMAGRDTPAAELDLSRFQLLGHVAGIGDVFVSLGQWIAGPMAPSRIEGIAIEWPNKPRNIDLRYAVRVGGQRPASSRMVEVGTYAGTRGRASPLVGATLEISGPGADGHRLAVDAVFLGSPQMRVTGHRVNLSGPTGREPLIGLRLTIEPVHQPKPQAKPLRQTRRAAPERDKPVKPAKPVIASRVAVTPEASAKRTGRVRVFRSGAKSKQ